MYKIIIFDFDGTIADTNKCIIETFQQSLIELGFDTMEEKDISRLIGLPLTHMYARLLHTDDKSLIDTTVATYRRLFTPISERTVTLFPHVAETLRQIHESGISTAIATSRGRDSLHMLLKVHDIAQYIDTDCCEEDVTNKKPAPDMVERIIFLMNDVCNTSSPKLVFSLCNHLTTAFRAGVAVPPADVHTAALRAQASCLTVEGWSHLTYYPSHNNILHSMTIKTFHRDYLLLKQSPTVIYLCLISTRETQHFSTL